MNTYNLLVEKIHQGKNPYQDFPHEEWGGTWYDDPAAKNPIFAEAMQATKPGLIIEVGSFVGESAIHMANQIKALQLEAAILCVDTWYASFEHWHRVREQIQMHLGRPDFYYKFMANVITHHSAELIVPFAMDSIGAARVIKWLGLVPQLVFIDGSHSEGDVFRDLQAYWDLLPAGGGLLVDDMHGFEGVAIDVTRFIQCHGVSPSMRGEKALFIKP